MLTILSVHRLFIYIYKKETWSVWNKWLLWQQMMNCPHQNAISFLFNTIINCNYWNFIFAANMPCLKNFISLKYLYVLDSDVHPDLSKLEIKEQQDVCIYTIKLYVSQFHCKQDEWRLYISNLTPFTRFINNYIL